MSKYKCRLCGSNKSKCFLSAANTHGNKLINAEEKFEYYKCNTCGSIFLTNVVTDQGYFEKYYDETYYSSGGIKNRLGRKITLISNKLKQRIISKYTNKNIKKLAILDVGCGFGEFLDALKEDVYEKFGTDISDECIRICKKKGIEVYQGDLKEIDFNNKKFDVITMWHVIEHLTDPESGLREASKLLKKEGVLLVSTPNAESLSLKWTRQDWYHLDAPRHLTIPSAAGMRKLGTKVGLKAVAMSNFMWEFPTDLFWSIRNKPYRFPLYFFYPVFKFLSEETIIAIYRK